MNVFLALCVCVVVDVDVVVVMSRTGVLLHTGSIYQVAWGRGRRASFIRRKRRRRRGGGGREGERERDKGR